MMRYYFLYKELADAVIIPSLATWHASYLILSVWPTMIKIIYGVLSCVANIFCTEDVGHNRSATQHPRATLFYYTELTTHTIISVVSIVLALDIIMINDFMHYLFHTFML